MLNRIILTFFILISTPAFAQQADSIFLQRAINALQTQRNSAQDASAVAEAKIGGLTDDLTKANAKNTTLTEELAKANAKIKELEDKLSPPKEDTSKE